MDNEHAYNYSIENDFSNGLTSGMLHQDIISSGINTELLRIDTDGDEVYIIFQEQLDKTSIETLDELIKSHVASPLYFFNKQQQHNITGKTSSQEYDVISQFIHGGSQNAKIYTISYNTDKDAEYAIKIYDLTNKKIIIEKTLSNSDVSLQLLGVVDNLSLSPAIWEISMKTTTGTAQISNLCIMY